MMTSETATLTTAPPADDSGVMPTAVIYLDGVPSLDYYGWAFSEAEDFRRMLEQEGIAYQRSFAVHSVWRMGDGTWRTAPLCGTVKH